MRLRRLLISFLVALSLLGPLGLLLPATAQAATAANCKGNVGALSIPTWYRYLNPKFDPVTKECTLDVSFPGSVGPILLAVFEILLFVSGILAVVFIMWGGIKYLISQGEPDSMKSARNIIINAIIGMVICIVASAIVNLVARNIT